MEEIDLPLIKGSLDKVPLVEVSRATRLCCLRDHPTDTK